jgi:hypothetical protein
MAHPARRRETGLAQQFSAFVSIPAMLKRPWQGGCPALPFVPEVAICCQRKIINASA